MEYFSWWNAPLATATSAAGVLLPVVVQMRSKSLSAAVWSIVTLAAVWADPLNAAETTGRIASAEKLQFAERAFVDFHARSGPSAFGHSFIVYGRLSANGRVIDAKAAGLYADGDKYWEGLLIPLAASIGRAKDDLTGGPEIIYRRHLTVDEFLRLQTGVNRLRTLRPDWHLLFQNCNDFVGEMAELIGLRRPASLMPPITYVSLLSALNGGQTTELH